VKTKNGEPAIIKELTVEDDTDSVRVTMWNDVATRSITPPKKRICIKNCTCDFNTFSRRMVIKVNELDAIEVYISEFVSITSMLRIILLT